MKLHSTSLPFALSVLLVVSRLIQHPYLKANARVNQGELISFFPLIVASCKQKRVRGKSLCKVHANALDDVHAGCSPAVMMVSDPHVALTQHPARTRQPRISVVGLFRG
jgi:hypothetical protein